MTEKLAMFQTWRQGLRFLFRCLVLIGALAIICALGWAIVTLAFSF